MNVLSSVTSHMNRLLRVSLLTGCLGLSVVIGAVSCGGSPLLAPSGTAIFVILSSPTVGLNSSIDVTAVLIESGQQSGGTGTGTGTGTSTGTSTTAQGTPVHDGTVVSFTTSIGRIEPAEARTSNGRVTVKLITGGESGFAIITAYSGGAKLTSPQVAVGTAAVAEAAKGGVTVSANPQALPSGGGTSTISAIVQDSNSNRMPGIPVTFVTSSGTLATTTATTNSTGVATTTLTLLNTTTAAVTANVKAIVGAVTSTDLPIIAAPRAAAATITLTASPASGAMSAPVTFTIDVGATVPVSNVTINYGDGSSRALGSFSGRNTAVHYYSAPNIYPVTVSATNADGIVTSASTEVAIRGLTGTLTAAPGTVARNSLITFTAAVTQTEAVIDHFSWDFGDGTSTDSVGGAQSHVYDLATVAAGIKTITVRVYPLYGSSFKITLQISVT